MTDAYIVTGPAVTVNVAGELRYLYRGAPVPNAVKAADIAGLVDLGLVAPATVVVVDEDATGTEAVVIPDGEPNKEWSVKALQQYGARENREIPKSAKTKDDILAALAKVADPSTNTDTDAGTTPAA